MQYTTESPRSSFARRQIDHHFMPMPRPYRLIFAAIFSGIVVLMNSACVMAPNYTMGPRGYYEERPGALSDWGLVRMPNLRMPRMPEFLSGLPGLGDGSYWDGDHMSGKPRIHIRLREQLAYFYKGNQLAGVSPICSGSPQFPTPKGQFKVQAKHVHHVSSIYGNYVDQHGNILRSNIDSRKDPKPPGARYDGAEMPYFMPFSGGVGMHAGYLPGYADSHGCVRLPERMARIFFANAPVGTPVTVTN
jgi:hypothetical protein